MIRKIIFHENHFISFYQNQDEKVKTKILYVLEFPPAVPPAAPTIMFAFRFSIILSPQISYHIRNE